MRRDVPFQEAGALLGYFLCLSWGQITKVVPGVCVIFAASLLRSLETTALWQAGCSRSGGEGFTAGRHQRRPTTVSTASPSAIPWPAEYTWDEAEKLNR